ncbi:MAG TPA: hypothetical protein PKE68_13000 [Saprospiraceae bacterium]|nr:hypothetical protein [Saprospiraceae bacterium]
MMRKENRVVAHVVVLLTLVLILALFMPLRGAIARADTMGIIRVSIMLATAVLAMAIFVKSFIDARRARKA